MAQIYRSTTPSIELSLVGVDLSYSSTWPVVVVTLKNGDKEIDVQRDLLDIKYTDTGCQVNFVLTQVQTLVMDSMKQVSVQLRAKDAAGHAIASQIVRADVADIIKDGEI